MLLNHCLQIKQVHDLPSHFAIPFLNLVKALFTSSFRVFHRRLPLHFFYKKPRSRPSSKSFLIFGHIILLKVS